MNENNQLNVHQNSRTNHSTNSSTNTNENNNKIGSPVERPKKAKPVKQASNQDIVLKSLRSVKSLSKILQTLDEAGFGRVKSSIKSALEETELHFELEKEKQQAANKVIQDAFVRLEELGLSESEIQSYIKQ